MVSDIDIVFYKSVIPTIEECMIDTEICFQKERRNYGINIGFMSIHCNKNTLDFWSEVYEIICNTNGWDQRIVNDLIYNSKFSIKWKLFPSSVWNASQGNLQKDIILHHANCVNGKKGKYEQMESVYKFLTS